MRCINKKDIVEKLLFRPRRPLQPFPRKQHSNKINGLLGRASLKGRDLGLENCVHRLFQQYPKKNGLKSWAFRSRQSIA
jgi:hypothetical protein